MVKSIYLYACISRSCRHIPPISDWPRQSKVRLDMVRPMWHWPRPIRDLSHSSMSADIYITVSTINLKPFLTSIFCRGNNLSTKCTCRPKVRVGKTICRQSGISKVMRRQSYLR